MADAYAAETRPAGPPPGGGTGAPGGKAQPSGGFGSLLPIIIIWLAVLYFFFMRPKKREEQQRRSMLDNVKKGDAVVTVGGIHGTVAKLNADTLDLRVDDSSKTILTVSRQAIGQVLSEGDGGAGLPDSEEQSE